MTKFLKDEESELHLLGYRTCPSEIKTNPTKHHAWFRFEADGYYEPAVLAEEMLNIIEIPKKEYLVFVIRLDNNKKVALVPDTYVN